MTIVEGEDSKYFQGSHSISIVLSIINVKIIVSLSEKLMRYPNM